MISISGVVEALKKHKNVLIYGPPGTGKSYLMKEVSLCLGGDDRESSNNSVVIDTEEERRPFKEGSEPRIVSKWVTFHQGYSYEDFILGMRPVAVEGGGFTIRPKPGVLLELVAEAQSSKGGLLLIDEINRGNTSKIFGEFITLMEKDKRLSPEGNIVDETVTVTLPYLSPGEVITFEKSEKGFKVEREFNLPDNIYILASMNSVDKSIAPMDTALRRRFHIINLAPTSSAILSAVGLLEDDSVISIPDGVILDPKHVALVAANALIRLNRSIGFFLGNDFMLGQWYLSCLANMSLEDSKKSLCESWFNRMLPQLIELFHGREEQLLSALKLEENKAESGSGLEVCYPSDEESAMGATTYIELSASQPDNDKVLGFLRALAFGSTEDI
ncbi:AAA family ATPase [Halomonas sp. Bachu 37]|uniref:McrB family protein n=1 Tax=Halomonas kashgarensis TaxID=3084920 RepID=UPI003216B281